MFKTPILLITFNRPNHTRCVLESIRLQQPEQLFVFQDGARENTPDDVDKCAAVRQVIVDMVDWPCQLHTKFLDTNLGCGPGPAAAITWFFDNVEQGIIVEDDAVVGQDFLVYAEELLDVYKNDTSVRAIGSICVLPPQGDGSYYFSMMNRNLCAWATWKRAWENFDISLQNITEKQLNACLRFQGARRIEREYWCEILKTLQKDGMNGSCWDVQFLMSIWLNKGKGICPNRNLSQNIGFDEEATHPGSTDCILANRELQTIMPLKAPSETNIVAKADRLYHRKFFQPYQYGWEGVKRFPYRCNKRLKRLLHHEGAWIKC